MREIRLNVGSFWDDASNIEADIEHINWNMENNRDKKVIINLPITYFDESLFSRITNLDAIEFEAEDGKRFKPKDIILINNKLNNILNKINIDNLSQFEKFIVIYSFVVNYKLYKLSEEKYHDIGRSPYLFLEDDYINCVGICQFLCILCRKAGINITMVADSEKEHAICYYYLKDDSYGIDGYFVADPTNDMICEERTECNYVNMVGRILHNNDFERFLNGNRKLSYPNDMINISLFSKYISFLKTNDFFVRRVDTPIDFLNSFRTEFQAKQNNISYDIIYNAILKLSVNGFIPSLNSEKDFLRALLFIREYKEKILAGDSTQGLVESFTALSSGKKK